MRGYGPRCSPMISTTSLSNQNQPLFLLSLTFMYESIGEFCKFPNSRRQSFDSVKLGQGRAPADRGERIHLLARHLKTHVWREPKPHELPSLPHRTDAVLYSLPNDP